MTHFPVPPLDLSGLHTYSVHGRHSKVSIDDFAAPMRPGMTVRQLLTALPSQLAGADFPDLVRRVAEARRRAVTAPWVGSEVVARSQAELARRTVETRHHTKCRHQVVPGCAVFLVGQVGAGQ